MELAFYFSGSLGMGVLVGLTITGRINECQFWGFHAICMLFFMIRNVMAHARIPNVILAVLFAYEVWRWWNDGGGDDTKKRWRRFKKKFEGVRRMAPVTA